MRIHLAYLPPPPRKSVQGMQPSWGRRNFVGWDLFGAPKLRPSCALRHPRSGEFEFGRASRTSTTGEYVRPSPVGTGSEGVRLLDRARGGADVGAPCRPSSRRPVRPHDETPLPSPAPGASRAGSRESCVQGGTSRGSRGEGDGVRTTVVPRSYDPAGGDPDFKSRDPFAPPLGYRRGAGGAPAPARYRSPTRSCGTVLHSCRRLEPR